MDSLPRAHGAIQRRVPFTSEVRERFRRADEARAAWKKSVSANASRKLTIEELRAWSSPPDKQRASLAQTRTNSPPDKALPSRGREVWAADLLAARGARRDRKAMVTPHHRRDMRTPMFDLVNGHLRNLARRTLNDRLKRGEPWARERELTEALRAYVLTECRHVIYHHDYGEQRASARVRRAYLDGDRAVDAVSASAARYVLATWTPTYMRERQERGRVGGSNGKRTPTWTNADLDALAKLAHLSTMQARADVLGRSLRTTERMSAALRQRSDAPDLDDLLAAGALD